MCDYAAAQKGNVTAHMHTHTREKPYTCDVLGADAAFESCWRAVTWSVGITS